MAQWNSNTAFTIVANASAGNPCAGLQSSNTGLGSPQGNGDGRNSADFRSTFCGNSFGNSVLAVTLELAKSGQLGFTEFAKTDILFNSNYQWDVYDGPRRSRIDFRRVALHELGHALGLGHEMSMPAIMAPGISNLYWLQADDIAGANAIYGGTDSCLVREMVPSAAVNDSLGNSDCRVLDLFGGSVDTSFVDVYSLRLTKDTDLDFVMHSNELDSVLILTDANLGGIEIHDDFDGGCDARIRKRLPAGEYRILANTYDAPKKRAGNTGRYNLTISDSGLSLLGTAKMRRAERPLRTPCSTAAQRPMPGGVSRQRLPQARPSTCSPASCRTRSMSAARAVCMCWRCWVTDGSSCKTAAGALCRSVEGWPLSCRAVRAFSPGWSSSTLSPG